MPLKDSANALVEPTHLPLLKRMAAKLLGRGLNRLGSQHPASWELGQLDGQRLSAEQTFAKGYEEGLIDGFEEGRQVLLIRDTRPTDYRPPSIDPHLFEDWRLPLGPELKKIIKADVAAKLPKHAQPSTAQWKMIFSDTPSTCVIAGAGAGKSTSLVLRVILLAHYLGYELDSLTVVTFTRESRKDFVQKLIDTFALWGRAISISQAKACVRTFHSCILPMVRSLPGLEKLRAFETLSDRQVSAANSSDPDSNPFELRINDSQRAQLNACYHYLYSHDEHFVDALKPLFRQALQLKKLAQDHPDVQKRAAATSLAANRDEELCDAVEDLWVVAGAWPLSGIEPQRSTLEINGSIFHCHGYHEQLQAWVVLGMDASENAQLQRQGAKLSLRAESAVKRTLFQAFSAKPIIWLDNYQAALGFADAALVSEAGPGIEYKLKGELASAPLLDCFVAAAGFIENLGLDVGAAIAAMSFTAQDPDRFFFAALSIFWPAFERHLQELSPPAMTYNRMFSLFGEKVPENLHGLPEPLLRPMAHLMIDEFQDISPQIVSWVRACLTEVRRRCPELHAGRHAQRSSLLCVGDDWQSIYGWRGSSPKFFMEFAKEFSSPATTRVMLSDNYRSHQMIIDAAEHIVRSAPAIAGKKAKACGPAAHEPVPVMVLDRDDALLIERLTEHYQRGDSILLLYRKSSDRAAILPAVQALLDEDRQQEPAQQRLKLLTYHSAKGLQADAVFLLGDCQYLSSSPYKNQVYRQAELGNANDPEPYDTAQKHEILRLAYVAITRAVKYCYWFIDRPGNEEAGQPRASARVNAQQNCFQDLREHEHSLV